MSTTQNSRSQSSVKFPHLLHALRLETYRAACDQRYRRAARKLEGGGK